VALGVRVVMPTPIADSGFNSDSEPFGTHRDGKIH
jgi:hypothetical protein